MSRDNGIISLSPEQICLGMHVILPTGWLDHPFLLNNFLIKSDSQLLKLKRAGLKRINIDLARSQLPSNWSADQQQPGAPDKPAPTASAIVPALAEPALPAKKTDAPPQWNPDSLIPDQLYEALHDKHMTPEVRAHAVYLHSRELMRRLLDSPTAENLKASKVVIGAISDVILSDYKTAFNMLRLTSHDFYTYTHSVNVGVISIMLAKALFGRSDAHDMHELGAGFFLHDLGKVSIPAGIINKPGKLTDEQMRHMRTHPYKGYKLLKDSGQLSPECRIIILQHHERADGTGYPKQIDNEQIHPYGKICCIADVFDALTSERSYKRSLSTFDALMVMKQQMADHFDKELFAKLVHLMH